MTTPRRRIPALLGCLALALATLGACGSDGDEADRPTETTAPDTEPGGSAGSGPGGDEPADAASPAGAGDEAPDGEGEGEADDGAGDAAPPGTSGDGGPCAAASALAEAFPGVAFGDPVPSTGEREVQDVAWSTVGCRWSSDSHEVRVQVAGPEGFADGFVCAEPLTGVGTHDVTPVDGLGDRAWWSWDDFQSGTGDLAACAGERRVDVTVRGPRGGDPIEEAEARRGATVLARALL